MTIRGTGHSSQVDHSTPLALWRNGRPLNEKNCNSMCYFDSFDSYSQVQAKVHFVYINLGMVQSMGLNLNINIEIIWVIIGSSGLHSGTKL